MLRVATVFSGIGAPEFALKRLNIPHKIVFCCDNGDIELTENEETVKKILRQKSDPYEKKMQIDQLANKRKKNFVKETYMKNYKVNEKDYHHDIRYLPSSQYKGKVDLLMGGPPCQAFSIVGYQKGLDDARGRLFEEFAKTIRRVQPEAFIFENVAGLVQHDNGRTWSVVLSKLESLGYKTSFKILNAKDYGIPQNRRRVFVIGTKKKPFVFPGPIPLKYKMQDFLETNAPYGSVRNTRGKITITNSKSSNPLDERYFPSKKVIKHIMATKAGNYRSIPKTDLEIARPILATMHKMHRASVDNYVTENGRLRMLTPLEAHRLMGFTDDFHISQSKQQGWKQAGNSIVVDVLMALIAKLIKDGHINKYDKQKNSRN